MGSPIFTGNGNEVEIRCHYSSRPGTGRTLLDTADMYGPFTNEELVGKAIKGKRKKVIVADKIRIVRTSDPNYRGVCGRPEYVRSACDASLMRLSWIISTSTTSTGWTPMLPIEEHRAGPWPTWSRRQVRFIGLSEAGVRTIPAPCRASDHRPADRILLWSRGPGRRVAAGPCGSWGSALWPTARWGGVS